MSPSHQYKKAEKRFAEKMRCFFFCVWSFFKALFARIAAFLRQSVTVMLVPHSDGNIIKFRISVFSILSAIFVMGCMVLAFVLYTTKFTGVSDMLSDKSRKLERREAYLGVLCDQISDLVDVSRVFEDSLHAAMDDLGIEDKGTAIADISESDAVGGSASELRAVRGLIQDSTECLSQIVSKVSVHRNLVVELPTIWPLKGVRGMVTSHFGPTTHPFTNRWYLHKGIDIAYSRGTKLVSTADGKVIEKGFEAGGYGNYIVIKHKYGFYTKYAHLDRIYVKEGQSVLQGDVIGTLGNTGLSTGPHLHYEVRIGSQVVDPQRYLDFSSKKIL